MKRIVLFVLTNLAVMVVLSIVLKVLGIDRAMAQEGFNLGPLLVFSAVFGFGGAIISLLISKPVAKWSTGAQIIDGSEGSTQAWLVETVRRLAQRANIGMPDVAIYEGAPNAFATGAFKNSALVAVSTGLLQSMSQEEVEAVLGHEVTHVANGDMVTLTLIQGVLNTFVIFLARIVGTIVDRAVFRSEAWRGPGLLHHGLRVRNPVRGPRLDHRRVVLAPARVPCRSWLGRVPRFSAADGESARAPGRCRAGSTPGIDARDGHHRPPVVDGVVLESPAGRAADRGASGASLSGYVSASPQTSVMQDANTAG